MCPKAYTQFSNLCRHKRTHLDKSSSFICRYCLSIFKSGVSFCKHKASCGQKSRIILSDLNETLNESSVKESPVVEITEKKFDAESDNNASSQFSQHLIELNSLLLKIQQDQQQQQQELMPSLNTLCYLIQSVLTFMLNKPQQSNAQFNPTTLTGVRNNLLFDHLADEYYNKPSQEVSQTPTRDNEMLFYHYLNYAINLLNGKNSFN